jgi:ribose/xylose/arabinose/galactoside ABC-type transport system permease subunit
MDWGKLGYYALKGITDASAAIAGGFIGFFAGSILEDTRSLPIIATIVLFLLIIVLKGAEAKMDDNISEDEFSNGNAWAVLIFTGVVIIMLVVIILYTILSQ